MTDKLSQNQLDTIVKQLRSGNKIEAVKLYREMTGLGLYEAKTAVDAIQLELTNDGSTGEDAKSQEVDEAIQTESRIGTPTQIPQDQLDKIATQLAAGNMPGAIQLYRQLTGASEFVAQAQIEALASKLNLTSSNRSSALNQSKGCFGTAAALAIVGLAILYKMIGA